MGVCSSNPKLDNKNSSATRKKGPDVFKILLLGSGGSGKSTIFKQLLHYRGGGFSSFDEQDTIAAIHSNIIESMRILCQETHAPLATPDAQAAKEYLEANVLGEVFDDLARRIQILWEDPVIQETWMRRDFQISDTAHYFFGKLPQVN